MATTVYKCPNCGAHVGFDPETQSWKCNFCDSSFTAEEIMADEPAEQTAQAPAEGTVQQVVYRCQNCGSEVVTDETTVATHCYYCHSPVVLQGKLTDTFRPDTVVPFVIKKEKAVEMFMVWTKKKRYIPQAFFKKALVEEMQGVYYPHFVSDCELTTVAEGEGRITHTSHTPQYIITKTDHYHVMRKADFSFRSILRPALSTVNRKLSDGIHPYPLALEKPFSDAYLTGFIAERRDIEAGSIVEDVEAEAASCASQMIKDTVNYSSSTVRASSDLKRMKTRYVLLPAWVLTYPNKKKTNDPYYFAMNGCTGEVCGKLPIDRKKLYLTALGLGAGIFAVCCIFSYFLF